MFCPPNSQSTKNMHKTHIFDQKIMQKKKKITDLPTLFLGPYQETNNFFFLA